MKEQKGITLIALIITIIVLSILAGVSINLVLGDNGIIIKAEEGAIKTRVKAYKEKIELLKAELEIAKGDSITIDELISEVNKRGILAGGKIEKVHDLSATITTKEGDSFVVSIGGKKIESGLYNENDEMIVSWEELVNTYGMNVEKDYTSSTYNTDAESPYSVFSTNNLGGKLVIGNDVTKIGNYGFFGCDTLTSIMIPKGVTSIGSGAFCNCVNLVSATIPQGITSIQDGTFAGCGNLVSVDVPEGITSIGTAAFQNCSKLTDITLPNTLTSIGNSSFSYCTNLANLTISEGVTSIGDYAFSQCNSLTSITIPSTVTTMGSHIFYACENITSIDIKNSVIGNYAFYYNPKLTDITLREGVTSIGQYAFFQCSSLETITIPSTVTYIGHSAFGQNENLTSIYIENGVTTIGEYVFSNCTNLTEVVIPNSVTSIESLAFVACSKLIVTIPDSVTTIGANAFAGVAHIYYSGTAEGAPWSALGMNGKIVGYTIGKGYGWSGTTTISRTGNNARASTTGIIKLDLTKTYTITMSNSNYYFGVITTDSSYTKIYDSGWIAPGSITISDAEYIALNFKYQSAGTATITDDMVEEIKSGLEIKIVE